MGFNLQARLSLDGNQFLRTMRNVERATERANRAAGLFRDNQGRLRNSLGQYAASANSASHANNRFGSSLSGVGRALTSPIRAVGSLTSGLGGLISAYAAVAAGQKAFNATILESAKYEQSSVMISAMLNDKKLGQDYMKLVDSFSINSPIMDSQSMLSNSKSFLTASKDMKQLEKMWSLAERMAAIDPYQG